MKQLSILSGKSAYRMALLTDTLKILLFSRLFESKWDTHFFFYEEDTMNFNNNQQLNINNLIQSETERISLKYNKDFLDCEDIMKITGLGRDNVRQLLRSKDFPTTKVGKRQVVSVLNFVTWLTLKNNSCEVANG